MSNAVMIIRPEDCIETMTFDLLNGKVKGSTTYNTDLDKCWTWRKQETNLWTGYSNEGKSLFLKQLCTIKALEEGWKFLVSAPEDYPAEEYFDDIIHTVVGRTTDKLSTTQAPVTPEEYQKAYELIKDKFIFVYMPPPDNTVAAVLEEFEDICRSEKIDGCIIDPIIKFARPKKLADRDDIYGAYTGSLCVDFARRTNTSFHLVMHQLTPTKDINTKNYEQPSMYRVKGGGSWSDGFDNVLFVWRPKYATDKFATDVTFGSEKIKRQKLVGIPQKLEIAFDRKSNRYTHKDSDEPLFDFNKFMKQPKKLIL
jgi:twinkle protein